MSEVFRHAMQKKNELIENISENNWVHFIKKIIFFFILCFFSKLPVSTAQKPLELAPNCLKYG